MKKNAANQDVALHPTVMAGTETDVPGGDVKPRILLVDDERQVLDGLALHLRRNYEVVSRTSGAAALEVLATTTFLAVISDLRMPKMDGIQLLTEVRSRAPDTTRILLTGFADVTNAIAAVNQAGVHRFLTKPCPPAVLASALEEAIASAEVSRHPRVDAQMTRLGRQATLGTMAGSIGQEIGTLVSALSNSLELVQSQIDRGEVPASEDIGVLGLVKNRMQDHTRALTELSRPRRSRVEHLDMGMLACSTVELLRRAGVLKGAKTNLVLPHSPLQVEADRGVMEGVLINLLKNAAEALDEKMLKAARAPSLDDGYEEPRITVSVERRGDAAMAIVVEDNGPGVAPENVDRLFDTYFTTKQALGATGLGLAIVREMVDQSGGRVEVTSTRGKGTRFTVLLPQAGNASLGDDSRSASIPPSGSIVRLAPRHV
ncbi:MAG: hypothetical protein JWP97_1738 [Labilithrix sp.]|nr:hypothetical protein [Labilithrix sp.]